MNVSRLLPLALCAALAACNPTASDPPGAAATPAAEAGNDTVAVYGDEAPVAIQAEPKADDGHAHNPDGSHTDGSDADHGAKGGEDHPHAPGQADHDH